MGRRSPEDRITLGFLAFSFLLAFTLELYFVLHFQDIGGRRDVFARLFQVYGAGDSAYAGEGDVYFPFALETIHLTVTQVLSVGITVGVLRNRPYRYPLQLAVSSYVAYSVVLYFWRAVVGGYENMPERGAWNYFIFYVPNLPWLLGNLLLAWYAYRAILRRFRGEAQDDGVTAREGPGRGAHRPGTPGPPPATGRSIAASRRIR
ncbi:hypothetical protein J7F01_12725 [Streptomyces sp. ISL-22]|uniref:EXPERA domain-containing protein n=1 Tax=Streptomyces curacoi TaxID=146536 RepID=A0A117P5H5_9ACTN|nr:MULTISPECIES: emopamil-binding family protein [Streptomyces]KUM73431.1 hypothetical protein AQI70_21950 [Streptomyces curacoi]MBT2420343.1 hypothetical protein [Streptomyces sp. ISL-24]MBT2433043.1 hypothetical protein [Streptomyces sp. ISL-22]